MKMFGKKSISRFLFFVSRVLTFCSLAMLLYIVIAWFSGMLELDGEGRFTLSLPFSNSVIKGIYSSFTLLSILSVFLYYTAFIFLLSMLFQTFSSEPLFTNNALRYLKYFTVLNIACPLLFLLILLLFFANGRLAIEDITISTLHMLMGLFAAFISAIFKQGVVLQEENNLTI